MTDLPTDLKAVLERIADALERLAPQPAADTGLADHPGYVWQAADRASRGRFQPVARIDHVPLELLVGIDQQVGLLLDNSRCFARGMPANNALLWGARGMGKSSLVKAIHGHLSAQESANLALVEIHREDIDDLPEVLRHLAASERRFIIFCDDLSFDEGDASYKALKAVLEGGLEGRPPNCIFYATSNRRHLLPRSLMENEKRDAINPRDVVDDKLALSDRFGLWLGFHACSQDDYLHMISGYADRHHLPAEGLKPAALEWSTTRGARSGRVAWQFIQSWAGRHGKPL